MLSYVVICCDIYCDMLWHWNEHNSETGIEIVHIEFRWIHGWFWIQLDFELTFTWLWIVNLKLMWAELELELCFKHAFDINLICLWLDFGGSFIAVDLKSTFRISSTILNKLKLNVWVDLGSTLTLFKTKLCRSCIRKLQLAICLLSSFLLDFDVGPAKLILILLRLWHLNINWSCSSGRSLSLIPRTSTGKGCGNGTNGLLSLPSTFPDAHSCRLTMILCVELLLPSRGYEHSTLMYSIWLCEGLCLFFVSKDIE